MRVLRSAILGSLAVGLLLGTGSAGRTANPKFAVEPALTPDQQVTQLIDVYRALPASAKLEPEGDRIVEQIHMVRGKLSPRSQEAIARLDASHSLRPLVQALQKNDQESLKNLVSKPREREILAERLTSVLPYIEPTGKKWEYKVVAESYVEKLGEGELAAGLGSMGNEGWELVGFEKGRFVFKREK